MRCASESLSEQHYVAQMKVIIARERAGESLGEGTPAGEVLSGLWY